MRLNTFILTLCVCALHVRAASIASEKKLDALDNVDLDDVALEPELPEKITVEDVDNNLRKTIVDIPVKIIEVPTVLDESSNDYVPSMDESIMIKRVDIDLANPGPPQRQEHETQNPENYGEKEKAIFGIKKSVEDTEKIFNQGFQELTNKFRTLFGDNEDLPAIQNNLQNLRHTFTDQIVKLNETIINNLKPDSNQVVTESEKKIKIVESELEKLQKKFDVGIDTLTEGVEMLTIIREEDEVAKTKSIINEKRDVAKADPETNVPTDTQSGTSSTTQTPTSSTQTSNPIFQWLSNFQNGMSQTFSDLSNALQNNVIGNQQASANRPSIFSFLQGLNGQNVNQGTNPATTEHGQNSVPGALSDPPVSPTTSAPWGQAIFQQVQNSWQNLINPGQNAQQTQTPQTQQAAVPLANNGPFSQAFQNIVQLIQRPNQGIQQTVNPTPASVSTNAPSNNPEKPDAQADAIPVPAQQAQQIPQSVPAQQPQGQNGPIQQFVQNNPIIKGIQSAVQRIQGTPNPETPRNEVVIDDGEEKEKLKGLRPGVNRPNQGDTDISGVVENIEEQKEENFIPKNTEEILEGPIKAEKAEIPSLSDKTE